MSEHNRAIKQAQQVLEHAAKTAGTVEVGYNQVAENPKAAHYRSAAALIGALVVDESEEGSG